ncbi:hypothetical protein DFH08DRAFT_831239 [Mycena albidolilacea]|uniref:Uncharacterized protein n=1 Tax=Mycena albidolilacea TaxID=1033008 RepID=A0AAD7AUW9_9AGAR|nr:hypothetical protein DFH08DRAFT_831239 [Mycena albidolilacea]
MNAEIPSTRRSSRTSWSSAPPPMRVVAPSCHRKTEPHHREGVLEDHCAANGKSDSYVKVKELMAAFSAAFDDRMVETKGLDGIDREKARHDAPRYSVTSVRVNRSRITPEV